MDLAEERLVQSFDVRTAAWARWGTVDGDVLAHMVNPYFTGGPRWPALRESFRVVRRDGALLVASDGLSDPYDEGEGPDGVNGLGLEVFAHTPDPIPTVPGSWLFQLVWQASQFAASRDDLGALLDEYGLLSTEFYGIVVPPFRRPRFVGADGQVGALLNVVEEPLPVAVDGPLSRIRLVCVTLLTLDELEFVIRGPEERAALSAKLREPRQASSLARESVLSDAADA